MRYSMKTEEKKKQGEKKVKKKNIAGRLLTQAAAGFLQLICFLCAQIWDDALHPVCTRCTVVMFIVMRTIFLCAKRLAHCILFVAPDACWPSFLHR